MKRDVDCDDYIVPETDIRVFKNEDSCEAALEELYESDLKLCDDEELFVDEKDISEYDYHIEIKPISSLHSGGYIIDCEIIKRILE